MEAQNSLEEDVINENNCPGARASENSDINEQNSCPKSQKRPKRVLQFSDGEMVEYSSEDETDAPKAENQIASIDPKTLHWMPWAWYQTVWFGSKILNGCDYVGEALADFFGITSPKYQFEIEEYKRMHAAQAEEAHRQDLEMGGWNENHRNNVITPDGVTNSE